VRKPDIAMQDRPHKNSMWLTRFDDPKQSVQVCPTDQEKINIGLWNGGQGYSFNISRKDARLLAKRINQCLDATVKK
jgi:hypothetical protein